MNNPKILIIGTGSLRNYGCEAIVQGTYNILRSVSSQCDIYLASEDFEYDRNVLPKDIKLVKYQKRFTPYRIYKGILRRFFHVGKGSPVRMDTSIGGKYDIILSSGGDNYCENPDHGIYDLLKDLMKIGAIANRKHKKYVLWGASVGPFHNPDIEREVMSNLGLTTRIFVREKLSQKYLAHFEALNDKVRLVADSAFQMIPEVHNLSKKEGKIYVGINMSQLAINHSIKNCDIDAQTKKFGKILNDILTLDKRIEFVLLPHVVLTDVQNDMNFLNPIYESIKEKDRVQLIQPGLGARKTKGLIKQLDLLIAARMHCCVAGISTTTPTLFITYSPKGRGMSEYAYGHHDYEIECAEIFNTPESFENRILQMIDHKDEIRDYLKNQSERFSQDSMKAGQGLKNIL